ncbi:MAG: FAD-dependent oxidoreductase [Candidatus Magasanikbacteria bacterium]|nr:FAD-dependent oxidoreductase [Candidatus Magasanikbacteria bacterium]
MSESVLSLLEKKTIAKDLLELRFTRPSDFSFRAGQFLQFFIPKEDKNILRSYSISSTPQDPYLEFCVKLLEDGIASLHFKKMNPAEKISIRGPRGKFTVSSEPMASYFVATGAGLAPIMSMIRDELEYKKNKQKIRLLFGLHSEENLFWENRLKILAQAHKNFVYDITLSSPKNNENWKGLYGRVTEHFIYPPASQEKQHYYICGNADMVRDLRTQILTNGGTAEQLHFEIF